MTEHMVNVHIQTDGGCGLCGRKDKHQHPWPEWDAFIQSQK